MSSFKQNSEGEFIIMRLYIWVGSFPSRAHNQAFLIEADQLGGAQ
jgi:hypothetical protein